MISVLSDELIVGMFGRSQQFPEDLSVQGTTIFWNGEVRTLTAKQRQNLRDTIASINRIVGPRYRLPKRVVIDLVRDGRPSYSPRPLERTAADDQFSNAVSAHNRIVNRIVLEPNNRTETRSKNPSTIDLTLAHEYGHAIFEHTFYERVEDFHLNLEVRFGDKRKEILAEYEPKFEPIRTEIAEINNSISDLIQQAQQRDPSTFGTVYKPDHQRNYFLNNPELLSRFENFAQRRKSLTEEYSVLLAEQKAQLEPINSFYKVGGFNGGKLLIGSFHEFFADMTTVIFSGDRNAVAKDLFHSNPTRLERQRADGRAFSNRAKNSTRELDEHTVFAPARRWVGTSWPIENTSVAVKHKMMEWMELAIQEELRLWSTERNPLDMNRDSVNAHFIETLRRVSNENPIRQE